MFNIKVERIEDTWVAETIGLKIDGENEACAESTDSIHQCLIDLACDIQDRFVMAAEDRLFPADPDCEAKDALAIKETEEPN